MFDDDRDASGEPEFLDARVSPDEVAAWAAACPAPEAIHTPFGELDPAALSRFGRLDALVALERLKCWAEAEQQRVLAAIAADPGDSPAWITKNLVREEVACALRIPEVVAEERLHTATDLVSRFPATLDLLREGEISLLHGRILSEATADLDDQTAARVEAAVLGRAGGQTTAAFRRSVARHRARLAPKTTEQRHGDALAERCVRRRPLPDAMGELTAVISAEDLAAVHDVLTAAAKRKIADGDPRTIGQLRADTLVDLILGRDTSQGGRGGAAVQITLALSTLTGADDQPGELAGYGPIPASMAREIAARPDSVWLRLITDDMGRLLDYGRSTYRPPAALADFVRAWDQRCVFPTCNRRAKDCDLDHLRDWQNNGETNFDNLAAECPRHHQMKHDADWTVERLPDGTIQWTSPTGHTYHRPLDPLPIDRTHELISDPDPPPF